MIILRKTTLPSTGVILYPTDEESEAQLRKMKDGDEVAVEAKRARSGPHHRWFFAMMNKIFDNQEQFKSVDNMLDAVKLELGWSDMKEKLNGDQWYEPKSISFHDMGQDEFNKFADPAIDKLCIHFKIDRELLEQESSERAPPSLAEEGPSPTAATSSPEDEQQPPSGGGSTPDSEKPEDAPETPVDKSSPDTPGNPDEASGDDDVKPSGAKKPTGHYADATEMKTMLDICQTVKAVEASISQMNLDDLFPPDKDDVLEHAEKRKAELAK